MEILCGWRPEGATAAKIVMESPAGFVGSRRRSGGRASGVGAPDSDQSSSAYLVVDQKYSVRFSFSAVVAGCEVSRFMFGPSMDGATVGLPFAISH